MLIINFPTTLIQIGLVNFLDHFYIKNNKLLKRLFNKGLKPENKHRKQKNRKPKLNFSDQDYLVYYIYQINCTKLHS